MACVPLGISEYGSPNPCIRCAQIALAGLRICRAHLRKREIGEDIGVAVERLVIDALQVVFGVQEEISEDHVSKSLDGPRELFVSIIFFRQAIKIRDHARICAATLLLPLDDGLPQFADRRSGFIGLAEGDIEGRDFRAVLAQRVQHVREMRAREWPASQNFLRALVDVHDDDARIGMLVSVRPEAKSQIERVELQPVDEGKDGRGTVANECVGVNGQRECGQSHADCKGNAPSPPRPQPFARDKQGATRFTARGISWHDTGIVTEGAAGLIAIHEI